MAYSRGSRIKFTLNTKVTQYLTIIWTGYKIFLYDAGQQPILLVYHPVAKLILPYILPESEHLQLIATVVMGSDLVWQFQDLAYIFPIHIPHPLEDHKLCLPLTHLLSREYRAACFNLLLCGRSQIPGISLLIQH